MKQSTVRTAALLLLLIACAAIAMAQTPYKVLHYTETTGYNHNTKGQSLGMFQADGLANNYTVTNDDSGNEFNSLANLQQYAVVVFSNTSGNSGLNATQRANFEAYIASGGSYLGIHAATDTYRHSTANGNKTGTWDWYAETVAGASVQENPNHTNQNHNNTMTHQQAGHPVLANIPSPWNKTEEYYYWENGYLNSTFVELLRVGQTGGNSYDSPRMMAHCKNLPGGGKAFYTALGHSANNFTSDQNFIQLISDAMGWMLTATPPNNNTTPVGVVVKGHLQTWHRIGLEFDGPDTFSETGTTNPYTDIRLDVTFTGPAGKSYRVPGHFAADGQAAETGADQGGTWRVYFCPDTSGLWTWQSSCRQAAWVAIDTSQVPGTAYTTLDTLQGSFVVLQSTKTGADNRAKGRLEYVGQKYRKYRADDSYLINIGADAPENFLAFYEFDQTTDDGGNDYDLAGTSGYGNGFNYSGDGLHHYVAHVQDWTPVDPTWQGGKGKGIIGAINYLASEGLNAWSGLLWNVGGDGDDVWPYINDNNLDRFDVSKLDQWEIVFSHADSLGMLFHAKLFETENDQDMSDQQWKLYFREMCSRFSHHLAWTWNLGEENTMPASHITSQARMLDYWDAYDHHRVVHTYPTDNWRDAQWLPQIGDPTTLTGVSIQDGPNDTQQIIESWLNASAAAGHQWVANWDEQNGASTGVMPDATYPGASNDNHDVMRQAMWEAFITGAEGMKCYFGYNVQHNDIDCEDFRSRDSWWDYMRIAKSTMEMVPFHQMDYVPGLDINSNDNMVMTDGVMWWLTYCPDGDNITLPLSAGVYSATMVRLTDGFTHIAGTFNPGSTSTFTNGYPAGQEWAVIFQRIDITLPIGWDYVNHFGHQVCWQAVDSDSVQVEKLSGDRWDVVKSMPADGCYEFRGCDGYAWFRLRAMNDLETQGRGIVSDAFQLQAKPYREPGNIDFPCGPELYQVVDMAGKIIRNGKGGRVDLQGLPPGIYTIRSESGAFLLGH